MLCLSRRRPRATWPECASAKQHKEVCRGRLSGARLRIFAQESALLRRGFCFTPAFGRRVGCARNGLGAKSKRKGEKKYRNGAPSETGPEPPETGPEPPETGPEFGNRDLNPRNGARFSRPVSNGPFLRFSQAGLRAQLGGEVRGRWPWLCLRCPHTAANSDSRLCCLFSIVCVHAQSPLRYLPHAHPHAAALSSLATGGRLMRLQPRAALETQRTAAQRTAQRTPTLHEEECRR